MPGTENRRRSPPVGSGPARPGPRPSFHSPDLRNQSPRTGNTGGKGKPGIVSKGQIAVVRASLGKAFRKEARPFIHHQGGQYPFVHRLPDYLEHLIPGPPPRLPGDLGTDLREQLSARDDLDLPAGGKHHHIGAAIIPLPEVKLPR